MSDTSSHDDQPDSVRLELLEAKVLDIAEALARSNGLMERMLDAAEKVLGVGEALQLEVGRVQTPWTSDSAWQEFVDNHPELRPEPIAFTDDKLLAAVAEAERQRGEWLESKGWGKKGRREGAWSHCVATVLTGQSCVGARLVPVGHRDVCRVAQALARLARAGRVKPVNRSWEQRRWALA
jgi:hypothetical protein